MIEKAINAEAKVSLQSLFKIKNIDFQYLKGYKSLIKKNKNDANWKHRDKDKDKDKAKSYNPFSVNTQS